MRTATRRLWAVSLQVFPALVLAVFLAGFESEADLSAISQDKPEQRIMTLEKLLSKEQGADLHWRAELLLGKSYLEVKDYLKAERILESPDLETSPLYEYSEYFLIQARQGSDPDYSGEDLWQKLYSPKGEASFKLEAADKLGNSFFNKKDFERALPCFEALLPAFTEDAGLRYRIARSYEATSRRQLAVPHASWLYIEAPAAKETIGLFEECPMLLQEVKRKLGRDDSIRRMIRLEEQGAFSMLEKELSASGNILDKDQSDFLKASILASRNKNLEAVNLYLQIPGTSKLHLKALERCVQDIKNARGRLPEIERKLAAVAAPEKERPLIRIFEFYKANSMSGDATRAAKELLAFSNPDAAEFFYKNGWNAYIGGNRKKAAAVFREMTKLLPPGNDYHQAALFSLLEMKDLDPKEAEAAKGELLETSRYGYYGYRIRGGKPPASSTIAQDLPPILATPARDSRRFKALLLAEAGLGEEAVAELEALIKIKERPELLWELALAASKSQIYPKSVRAARKIYPNAYTAGGDRLPRQAWELIYPLPYLENFRKTAKEQDLPLATLYSIARQESLFDRNAVSKAGARGMIQLLPSTARMVAKRNGMVISSEDQLSDVDVNLYLGSRYFHSLLDMFDSKLPAALAGYNAGPGNPAKWRDRPNSPPDETLFIESIPYRETRSYVKRIMNNIWEYQRLYPELADK